MHDGPPTSEELRAAGRAALRKRRMLRDIHRAEVTGPLPLPPEHYHLIYFHPRTDTMSTDWETRYDTSSGAFHALKDIAQNAEPNVEYYEDGQIGFETRVHGMLGQHWMIAAVGMCTRKNCRSMTPILSVTTL